MDKYPIYIQPPVDRSGTPDVKLIHNQFESLIAGKGYKTYIDRMMQCPCKERENNAPRLTCKNCYGTGWIMVERIQTITMLQSMNLSTEYKDWSQENAGTASITSLSTNAFSFMDRVVLYEEESEYRQLAYPIELDNGNYIAFLDYPPVTILDVLLFNGDEEPLLRVDASKIKIDKEGRLDLNEIKDLFKERESFIYTNSTSISIRFTYHPSYTIIDIPRNVISSPTEGVNKEVLRKKFPTHAIGRWTHLVLERGDLIYKPDNMNDNLKTKDSTLENTLGSKLIVNKDFCDTENKE